MKGWKLLCHDIREGLWKKRGFYLFSIFVAMLSGIELGNQITALKRVEKLEGAGSLMDYWIYLMQGKEPYQFSLDQMYEFPVIWIGFFLFFFMAVNVHPIYDLEHWGYQMVTRVKSRGAWWLSKCIWCLLCCLAYFALAAFATLLMTVANGAKISIEPTWYVMESFSEQRVMELSLPMLLILTVAAPCLMAYFFALLQMVLSLRLHSLVSFCILTGVVMASAYTQSYFLPGNWGMPYRMDLVAGKGLHVGMCFALLLSGIFLCILIGKFLFDRQNILEKV